MAYDEFNGSSFDLNSDGHIDCAEASFIEDTYYGSHHGSADDDDFHIECATRHLPRSEKRQQMPKKKEIHRTPEEKAKIAAVLTAVLLPAIIFVILHPMEALVLAGIFGFIWAVAQVY